MGITQTNALARELLSIIERRIAEKRQADPKLDYGESWRVLASERPDLIRAYDGAAGAHPKADCRDLWKLVERDPAQNRGHAAQPPRRGQRGAIRAAEW